MKSMKLAIATTALTAAASVLAPPANAYTLGNYDVLTNRYERASWSWSVIALSTRGPGLLEISAAPRLKFYAYYDGFAHLADGRWTLTVDVPDGLQCLPGYSMPTRDTYTWDEVTLAGTTATIPR